MLIPFTQILENANESTLTESLSVFPGDRKQVSRRSRGEDSKGHKDTEVGDKEAILIVVIFHRSTHTITRQAAHPLYVCSLLYVTHTLMKLQKTVREGLCRKPYQEW
jgi:hypothetical protein